MRQQRQIIRWRQQQIEDGHNEAVVNGKRKRKNKSKRKEKQNGDGSKRRKKKKKHNKKRKKKKRNSNDEDDDDDELPAKPRKMTKAAFANGNFVVEWHYNDEKLDTIDFTVLNFRRHKIKVSSDDISSSLLNGKVFTAFIEEKTPYKTWAEWKLVLTKKKNTRYVGMVVRIWINNSNDCHHVKWHGDFIPGDGVPMVEFVTLVQRHAREYGQEVPFTDVCTPFVVFLHNFLVNFMRNILVNFLIHFLSNISIQDECCGGDVSRSEDEEFKFRSIENTICPRWEQFKKVKEMGRHGDLKQSAKKWCNTVRLRLWGRREHQRKRPQYYAMIKKEKDEMMQMQARVNRSPQRPCMRSLMVEQDEELGDMKNDSDSDNDEIGGCQVDFDIGDDKEEPKGNGKVNEESDVDSSSESVTFEISRRRSAEISDSDESEDEIVKSERLRKLKNARAKEMEMEAAAAGIGQSGIDIGNKRARSGTAKRIHGDETTNSNSMQQKPIQPYVVIFLYTFWPSFS